MFASRKKLHSLSVQGHARPRLARERRSENVSHGYYRARPLKAGCQMYSFEGGFRAGLGGVDDTRSDQWSVSGRLRHLSMRHQQVCTSVVSFWADTNLSGSVKCITLDRRSPAPLRRNCNTQHASFVVSTTRLVRLNAVVKPYGMYA